MKKFSTVIIIVIILVFIITSCTSCNVNIGPGSYTFTKVHIADFAGNANHATLNSWKNDDVGIEVNTKEYGSIFLSEGTYILYNNTCPVCGK